MEWFVVLLIVVPALIALVIWDVQSNDTKVQAPSFSSIIPRSEATRPVLIGLAIATLLGWGLFLYAELDKAENQRGARREIRALSANEELVRNQVAELEQSAGSLADLQNKIAKATNRDNQATANRDQDPAPLGPAQKELEAH